MSWRATGGNSSAEAVRGAWGGEAGSRIGERREGAGVDEDSGGRVMGRGSGDQEVVYGGGCNNACDKSIMLVRGEKVKKDYDGNIKGTILSGTTHRSDVYGYMLCGGASVGTQAAA